MTNRPAPEIELDTELARQLLRAQHPDLADQSISVLSRGWDNTNFRLGEDHLLRMPHRQVADQLIVNEQRWLPTIADLVELGVPKASHIGVPTDDYPWHWSVTPWFEGSEAAEATLTDPAATAETLGRFFRQLHQPAPKDAPLNDYRGCPIRDRSDAFTARVKLLDPQYDRSAITEVFSAACTVDDSTEQLWLHGDLHTRNLVVDNGELTAAIDWGDICAGDPATDLAAAFMLVPNDIATVQEHAGATEEDWQRARGWAINFAVVYLAHSDDDPVMYNIGTRLLADLLPGSPEH